MSASVEIGQQLGFWTLAPFACMLVAVAIMPLVCGCWFERNWNKGIVALVLGVPTVVYLIAHFGHTGLELAAETGHEYVSFIVLLFALFTVSGGIYLTGNLVATPRHNLAFLAVGAVLASFIGTMGASMVLIRPLLRANSERKYAKHTVVFFIFAVSNMGGLLTPLGDPPLFLGFLRGVPFTWTFGLWAEWLTSVGLVLLAYMAFEFYYHRKEPEAAIRADVADYVPMRIKGWFNAIPLALVIVAVLLSNTLKDAGDAIHFPFVREVILVALAIVSLTVGPRGPRAANHFHWSPMIEVGVLLPASSPP